ncbi:hypothetical protein [uncultured Microbulbifer sp.]|uniref:hypothetical protein n=1 Tax=uncultured Microbulbifer sp. TaxID=348147 RepID=UPI0026307375|nr:hypothetical protein [uncultured Microbulbifer sp.]
MPILPCRLFQPLRLGGYFVITLVAITENAVDLHIAPGKGNRVMRAVRLLRLLEEAWALEETPTDQTPAILRPFKHRPNKKT